jgi:hypothetical protein
MQAFLGERAKNRMRRIAQDRGRLTMRIKKARSSGLWADGLRQCLRLLMLSCPGYGVAFALGMIDGPVSLATHYPYLLTIRCDHVMFLNCEFAYSDGIH